jgi:hypothetical protein
MSWIVKSVGESIGAIETDCTLFDQQPKDSELIINR